MRSQFDKQLAQLHRELIEMGALCEQVIALSSQALTNRDTALAEKVAPLDHEIDRKEREIEAICPMTILFYDSPQAMVGTVQYDPQYFSRQDIREFIKKFHENVQRFI